LVDRRDCLRRFERRVRLPEKRVALVGRENREPVERRTGSGQRVLQERDVVTEYAARAGSLEKPGRELDAGRISELGYDEAELTAHRARTQASQLQARRRRIATARRLAAM